MIARRYGGVIMLSLACAAGSYLATYALQQDAWSSIASAENVPPSVVGWLELSEQQTVDIDQIEKHFAEDQALLEERMNLERDILAAMFESTTAADDEFLAQVEKVIEAHDALERRIAQHLVDLRPHLTTEQQRRLFNRFANSVREVGRHGWRHGQNGQGGGECRYGGQSGSGRCNGGGPPPGRGWRRNVPATQPAGDVQP